MQDFTILTTSPSQMHHVLYKVLTKTSPYSKHRPRISTTLSPQSSLLEFEIVFALPARAQGTEQPPITPDPVFNLRST
ncbi:hypothetical protein JMJ77_0004090 [Colletotrichum scovillei]|uniref:Uncharacterized protein n=1 Tax=Colletotrichum scovillei TaxID=1209932 RepID=A0A9P7QZT7_9PEZI|nr:hypothetical protein JMJ77_0004090 [Colletotrichum scovillei]KAG7049338.1 hypothetical protein JMJ78_0013321 [Colletotrichum scovillei]